MDIEPYFHHQLYRRTADNIIHITDWLPTLLEAAGANEEIFPELADIDGISQVHITALPKSSLVNVVFHSIV